MDNPIDYLLDCICFIDILKKLNTSNLLRLKEVNRKLRFYIKQNMKYFEIICNGRITDEQVKALAGCHTIDLRNTKVTDEGVKALAGCHTINLCYTKVTNEGVKALAGCHTIDLSLTKVTDEGVKALAGCHTIDLS